MKTNLENILDSLHRLHSLLPNKLEPIKFEDNSEAVKAELDVLNTFVKKLMGRADVPHKKKRVKNKLPKPMEKELIKIRNFIAKNKFLEKEKIMLEEKEKMVTFFGARVHNLQLGVIFPLFNDDNNIPLDEKSCLALRIRITTLGLSFCKSIEVLSRNTNPEGTKRVVEQSRVLLLFQTLTSALGDKINEELKSLDVRLLDPALQNKAQPDLTVALSNLAFKLANKATDQLAALFRDVEVRKRAFEIEFKKEKNILENKCFMEILLERKDDLYNFHNKMDIAKIINAKWKDKKIEEEIKGKDEEERETVVRPVFKSVSKIFDIVKLLKEDKSGGFEKYVAEAMGNKSFLEILLEIFDKYLKIADTETMAKIGDEEKLKFCLYQTVGDHSDGDTLIDESGGEIDSGQRGSKRKNISSLFQIKTGVYNNVSDKNALKNKKSCTAFYTDGLQERDVDSEINKNEISKIDYFRHLGLCQVILKGRRNEFEDNDNNVEHRESQGVIKVRDSFV